MIPMPRGTELRGRAVIDLSTVEQIGAVVDVVLDPETSAWRASSWPSARGGTAVDAC